MLHGEDSEAALPIMPTIREIQLDVVPTERDVLRLLGYREGTTQLSGPMRSMLEEARAAALPHLRARVAIAEAPDPRRFGAGGVFANVQKLVIGVATIGAELEALADRFVAAREWTKAMILDAYGSAGVEAAAVEANGKICEEAEGSGLVAGRRRSPGFPKWPIEQQRRLFEILGGNPAGVALNEAFVMVPRKSISFGIPLGAGLDAASPELGCRYCAMANCAYRRHGPVEVDG
jgi:hypothetical protein